MVRLFREDEMITAYLNNDNVIELLKSINVLGVKFEIWLDSDPILRNLNAIMSLQWYKANG